MNWEIGEEMKIELNEKYKYIIVKNKAVCFTNTNPKIHRISGSLVVWEISDNEIAIDKKNISKHSSISLLPMGVYEVDNSYTSTNIFTKIPEKKEEPPAPRIPPKDTPLDITDNDGPNVYYSSGSADHCNWLAVYQKGMKSNETNIIFMVPETIWQRAYKNYLKNKRK